MLRRLPLRLRLALTVFAINVAIFTILRGVFWAAFHGQVPPVEHDLLWKAFFLGLRFDIRLAVLLVAPFLAFSWMRRFNPEASRWARRGWLSWWMVSFAFCAVIYGIDFGHYAWTHGRINAELLEDILPLKTSMEVAWETYPVVWIIVALLTVLTLYGVVLQRFAFRVLDRLPHPPSRWVAVPLWMAVAVLCALGVNGRLAGYPLRWSDAFFSGNPFLSALGLNPVLYFFDTWERPRQGCDPAAVKAHYDEVARYVGVDTPSHDTLAFSRQVRPQAKFAGAPNIVLIFMESFGASKVGACGNALPSTPRFDAVARESLFFKSFFAASLPTGRAICSVVTGIPDVTPGDSASDTPGLVRQPTLINAFTGYEKMYFYTGDLSWANIRGLLTHNIPDIRLYQSGDYTSPRSDGWGISDLDLFKEAHEVLRQPRAVPFFVVIQTSGNHPPYTIPGNNDGFQRVEIDDVSLRQNDFRSLKEFNGIRFLDHSLGRFFDLARDAAYFKNTLFFIMGDHGARGTGSPLELIGGTAFHVPLAIYGPGLIPEGAAIDVMGSSLDVLPTAASMAGLSYVNTTLGRDLFTPRPPGEDFVFMKTALADREFFYFVPGGSLYRYRSDTPARDVRAEVPERAEEMKRRWTGLYETARYMLHRGRVE